MIRDYWRQLQKPGFIAFHELALAARTNSDLAAILHPMQDEFSQRFNMLAAQLYPSWQKEPKSFRLAMALSQTMMEGMAVALLTGALSKAMVEPLLTQLEERLSAMRPKHGAEQSEKP
jgi:hypothetical protein